MISESQQEQAALYALGLLDADEAGAFERQIDADAELRALAGELREAVALLALSGDGSTVAAPAALRERVLAEAMANEPRSSAPADRAVVRTNDANQVAASRIAWLPWAIAALFMGCSGVLLFLYSYQWQQISKLHSDASRQRKFELQTVAENGAATMLAHVSFCALEPTPDFATAQPRAAVLWDAAHRQGKLRVNRLAPPAAGKDYQLWTVEAGRKEPVSAGVVHVDADGKADLPFQPVDADGKPVVAVAISLEQAGGSPTNQGPILLLGKF